MCPISFWEVIVTSTSLVKRKSSCVNARSVPPAAYQVLHMLSCPGEGGPILGTPDLAKGYRIPGWGYPILGYNLARSGVPSIQEWGTPQKGTGTSHSDTLREGIWDQSLGYPQKGHGTSGSIMRWRWGTPSPR